MRNLTRHLLIVFGAVFIGCGSVPPTYYYRLDYDINTNPSSVDASVPVTLGIGSLDADLLYESEKIVYRDTKYEAKFYNYRKWIAPPKKMIGEKIVKDYQRSGRFNRVIALPSSQPADYILGGRVLSFEEWDEGQSWYGSVAIEFSLKKADSYDTIWEKTLSDRTAAANKEPAEVVIAINKSLNKVIQQSIEDTSNFLATQ